MVLAVITILGRRFRLVLLPERGSVPPVTIDTTAEPVEPSAPGLAKTRPSLRVVRSTEAA